MQCKCCKHEIKGIVCERCKYDNAVYLQGENDPEVYRNKIIDSLRDFRLQTALWKWDNEQGKLIQEKSSLKLLETARECFGSTWFSEPIFSQSTSDIEKQRVLNMEYTFRGEVRSLSVKIKPVKSDGLLQIGLHIDEEFNLTILLGTPGNFVKVSGIELDIK